MSISAFFDITFVFCAMATVCFTCPCGAEAEADKRESCLSRSAKSFDKPPWNSGFAVLHG